MELGNRPISCPVCTLYMREGVTLESHLDTHPKDKVIEALVKISSLAQISVQETPSDYFRNVQNVLPSVSRASTTQCISNSGGNFLPSTRSSMSAVINYQQLLSNGGAAGTILPQYVPVSTLLSGSESVCSSPVVYNPFLLQQQQVQIITSKKSSSGTQSMVHQYVPTSVKHISHNIASSVSSSVPFQATSYTNISSALTPSICQAKLPSPVNSVSRVPSSPPIKVPYSDVLTSLTQVYPDSFSHSALMTSTIKTQKQDKTLQDNSSSSCVSIQTADISCRNPRSRNDSVEISEKVQILEVSSKKCKFKDNGTENIQNCRSRNNSTENNEIIQISEQVCDDQLLTGDSVAKDTLSSALAKEMETEILEYGDKPEHALTKCDAFLDDIKMSDVDNAPSNLVTSEANIQGEPELANEMVKADAKRNQEMVSDSLCEVTHENYVESNELAQPDTDMVNVLQPPSPASVLRVRHDLNCCSVKNSLVESPDSSYSCDVQELDSKEENQSREQQLKNEELLSVASSSGCILQVFSTEDEYITSDSVYVSKEEILLSEKLSCEVDNAAKSTDEAGSPLVCGVLNGSASENVNLVTFDGVHIIVPSEFLGSPGHVGDHMDSSNDSHVITELTAVPPDDLQAEPDVTTMNIQTDEMMPPKGELSEQESVGGNDSSLWAPVTRADDNVCASYDLLARESWEASDGSDGEGNELFTPTMSEKLNLEGSNSEVKSNKSSSSRATRRPKAEVTRTYLCITCEKIFNCPKERRVHQRMSHHGEGGSRTKTIPKRACTKRQEGETKLKSVKCEKKDVVEEKNPSEGSDYARFEEVFIVKTEVREEKDEAVAGEDHKVSTCNSEAQAAKKKIREKSSAVSKSVVPKELHSCPLCDKTFSTLKLLRVHNRSSHFSDKTAKLTCKSCNKKFPNEALMQVHFKIHPLECSRCGKYFYRRQNLKLHIKRHLGIRPFKCDVCDKSFVTRQKLEEHTNVHTGNAPLKCSVCGEKFRRYSNLIQHRNSIHLKIKKKVKDFICQCGEIFHSKKKLEWHKEIHDTKPKSCLCCSERYVHETSLTRHIRKAHDSTYVSKRSLKSRHEQCSVCGNMFLKSSLPVHMRVHTGVKPFSCPVCGKKFTTKWNLNLHRWTHASRSSKPFKCSLCKSAFFRQNDYKSHMHSHRNMRPYTCNYCGCQFIRKYNCQRHVREHEKNKSFSCTVCGKLFHRNYYLTEHMRVHSGSRPFACHICGKASSTKSNHNKHVRIHHAREPVNTEG